MSSKAIGAAEFKAKCLHLIEQMADDGEPIVITKRGKPVAVLSPIAAASGRTSIIGAMKGTVLAYDDPFSPAVAADEWDASR
ncbi:type II toxin-antitoxin system Phd/YefM family antitoxin [Rhizobium herbae]|uniref:Antitoxin n=1 Tax=Rhizobium herbae TaxID=508661 RepID=A0ABS7H6E1_9HYPH|nr:type II toxin-antitoxin system Phd/YefM family antitoxin [Rhizobium herbae]MBW9062816.1 type II toxin-antitoxin system Phd/YefM family antitoxin [Rhizobium herbae]